MPAWSLQSGSGRNMSFLCVFPSIQEFGLSSSEFCVRMIREAGLAATPGSCFGAEGYIRLTYCYGNDQLHEGLDRLERFICMLRTKGENE